MHMPNQWSDGEPGKFLVIPGYEQTGGWPCQSR